MSIPKYDEMYNSFLECIRDGNCYNFKDIKDYISSSNNISKEELRILTPSQTQTLFNCRVGWTKVYLIKAGLVERVSKGLYRITSTGLMALQDNSVIDNEYLKRFPSFCKFVNYRTDEDFSLDEFQEESAKVDYLEDYSPLDKMDLAYYQSKEELIDTILQEIIKKSPKFFEHLVVELLKKMGYGGSLDDCGIVTGQVGDEGIDGIIREDKLGFSNIYIQAKRYALDTSIGRPEVQKFVGALAGQGAGKGLLITTAKFTQNAKEYAQKQHTTRVVLVDGRQLASLMIEYEVGITIEKIYTIKKLNTDFFSNDC